MTKKGRTQNGGGSVRGKKPKPFKLAPEERLWSGGKSGMASVIADVARRDMLLMALQSGMSKKTSFRAIGWARSNWEVWKKLSAEHPHRAIPGHDGKPVQVRDEPHEPLKDFTYGAWFALLEGAREQGRLLLLARLRQLAQQGADLPVALKATIESLKLQFPRHYNVPHKFEHTGKDGDPLPAPPRAEVDSMLESLAEKLRDAETRAEPSGTAGKPPQE